MSDDESEDEPEVQTEPHLRPARSQTKVEEDKDGSATETNSEFDVEDDLENYGAVAGLEMPTSMISIDLDKFTQKIGINPEDFK